MACITRNNSDKVQKSKNSISLLNELVFKMKIPLPKYTAEKLNIAGSNPCFSAQLEIEDKFFYGKGPSIKEARQDSAQKAIDYFEQLLPVDTPFEGTMPVVAMTHVADKYDLLPIYQVTQLEKGKLGSHFNVELTLGIKKFYATGREEKIAKCKAAHNALSEIRDILISFDPKFVETIYEPCPILKLFLIARRNRMDLSFNEVTTDNSDEMVTTKCTFGPYVKTSSDYSKENSKRLAASAMLEHLQTVCPSLNNRNGDLDEADDHKYFIQLQDILHYTDNPDKVPYISCVRSTFVRRKNVFHQTKITTQGITIVYVDKSKKLSKRFAVVRLLETLGYCLTIDSEESKTPIKEQCANEADPKIISLFDRSEKSEEKELTPDKDEVTEDEDGRNIYGDSSVKVQKRKNSISLLNELAFKMKISAPKYTTEKLNNASFDNWFSANLKVGGESFYGEGPNIKIARQNSAQKAIDYFEQLCPPDTPFEGTVPVIAMNFVAHKYRLLPIYQVSQFEKGKLRSHFNVELMLGTKKFYATGRDEKITKCKAAYNALFELRDILISFDPEFAGTIYETCPILKLFLIARRNRMDLSFNEVTTDNSDEMVTTKCTLGPYVKTSSDHGKENSKQLAASAMLEHLQTSCPSLINQSDNNARDLDEADENKYFTQVQDILHYTDNPDRMPYISCVQRSWVMGTGLCHETMITIKDIRIEYVDSSKKQSKKVAVIGLLEKLGYSLEKNKTVTTTDHKENKVQCDEIDSSIDEIDDLQSPMIKVCPKIRNPWNDDGTDETLINMFDGNEICDKKESTLDENGVTLFEDEDGQNIYDDELDDLYDCDTIKVVNAEVLLNDVADRLEILTEYTDFYEQPNEFSTVLCMYFRNTFDIVNVRQWIVTGNNGSTIKECRQKAANAALNRLHSHGIVLIPSVAQNLSNFVAQVLGCGFFRQIYSNIWHYSYINILRDTR